jgi:hypothetical protein
MARYHVAFTTAAAATNTALVDIRTASTDRVRVLEIGLFNTAATAATVSVERQTTLGTTSTTVVPQAGEPGDPAATVLIGTAWSSAPASTAVPLRRMTVPANIGGGVIWTFGYGDLVIPVSSSILVMNRGAATTGIMVGYFVLDE